MFSRVALTEETLMDEQLIETWNIHNRINLYLLDAIPDEALDAAGSHELQRSHFGNSP